MNAGYVVGIDGEIMLGLGRTEHEAWDDARNNNPALIAKRQLDVMCYPVVSESTYKSIEIAGDGYKHNAFTEY